MAENTSLKNLNMDIIKKAFDETRQSFEAARRKDKNLSDVKLVHVTEEYYDQALEFARDHFVPNEPLHKASGVVWSEEIAGMFLKSLKHNLSLMFISEANQEPIAFRVTRIQRHDDIYKMDVDAIKSEPLRNIQRYNIHCDALADFFGHYGTQESFHFLGLCVSEKYKRRGLATHIIKVAIDMIRNLGVDPVYLKVEGSSNYSMKLFEKLGFEALYEQPFATWEVDGKFPMQDDGFHKSMKMYGMKLTSKQGSAV